MLKTEHIWTVFTPEGINVPLQVHESHKVSDCDEVWKDQAWAPAQLYCPADNMQAAAGVHIAQDVKSIHTV